MGPQSLQKSKITKIGGNLKIWLDELLKLKLDTLARQIAIIS